MRIRPGEEEAFALWRQRHQDAIASSTGLLSSTIIPIGIAANRAWIVVLTFRTAADLEAWQSSTARVTLVAEALPLYESGNIGQIMPSDDSAQSSGENVVEVILSRIKPGMDALYHTWTVKIERAQASFPGYRGLELQPPVSSRHPHWTALVSFDTKEHLLAWMESPERAELVRESKAFIEAEEISRVATAFPGWVPVNPATGESPPNWKTAMLVLLGLFPTVVLETRFLSPHLSFFNHSVSMFIGNVGSVAITTFLTMPLCIRWFGWWLFVDGNSPRNEWTGLAALLTLYALEIALLWRFLA